MPVKTVRSRPDFDKQLEQAGDKLVVVDFYATWCGPCKDIEPTVRALAKKYASEAVVLKVNVDKLDDISDYYKVSSMPTFVFIRNKRKLTSFSGSDDTKLATKMSKLVK